MAHPNGPVRLSVRIDVITDGRRSLRRNHGAGNEDDKDDEEKSESTIHGCLPHAGPALTIRGS